MRVRGSERTLRRRAFTLVELMVAMVLGAILIGVVAFIFLQATKIRERIVDEVDSALYVRGALEVIKNDLQGIQFPWQPGMAFQIERIDSPQGVAQDALQYVTVESSTRQPIVVRIELEPSTRMLVRTIQQRWNVTSGGWATVNERQLLSEDIGGFRVEYAWPDAAGNAVFTRGTPPGSSLSPADGSLFVYRGDGVISPDGLMTFGAAWDGATPLPRFVRTVHVLHPDVGGPYPVLGFPSPTSALLAQAPAAADAQFVIPLLPPDVRVSIQHNIRQLQTRSVQRVFPVLR